MRTSTRDVKERVDIAGYAVVLTAFSAAQIAAVRAGLDGAFQGQQAENAISGDVGSIYAARNLLDLWPEIATVWQQPSLVDALAAILGRQFGLVRALYFDKPPERTWALPWHKDMTIAVRDNQLPSRLFTKPTVKAGVPHVEAPLEVLEQMLTARIHLDDVTLENGPLRVIPGSHRDGKGLHLGDTPPSDVLATAGDVLLMRPLLAHASNRSVDGTRRHRRILHLEFTASVELPDGYSWHRFFRPADAPGTTTMQGPVRRISLTGV